MDGHRAQQLSKCSRLTLRLYRYDNGNFAFSRWPSYFDKYGRKEPDEPTHNPLSYAYGREDKTFWDIVSGERLEDFNVTMQMLEHLLPVCGMFPFKW